MSDMGDFSRQYREDQQKRRAERLPIRQKEIEALANEGYEVKKITEWQYRINNTYDLYPIHNRWHHLKSGKRDGAKNLADFIRENLKLKP
jgi:hypothetical protein